MFVSFKKYERLLTRISELEVKLEKSKSETDQAFERGRRTVNIDLEELNSLRLKKREKQEMWHYAKQSEIAQAKASAMLELAQALGRKM